MAIILIIRLLSIKIFNVELMSCSNYLQICLDMQVDKEDGNLLGTQNLGIR